MARRPGYNTQFPNSQFNSPVQYRGVVPGTTPQSAQISQFAGMPVGVDMLTRWYLRSFVTGEANTLPAANTAAGDSNGWITTTTGGASVIALSDDLIFPRWRLTTGAADNDSVETQFTGASGAGEFIRLGAGREQFFRAVISLTDAADAITTVTQVDWFLGFAVTDTTLIDGVADYIGFHSPDGSADINFVMGKTSVGALGGDFSQATGTTLTAADAGNNDFIRLDFRVFDASNVMVWVNDQHALTINETTEMPDSTNICPSIALQNGEAVVKTMNVAQMVVGQKFQDYTDNP
jgi:hypothetical protein